MARCFLYPKIAISGAGIAGMNGDYYPSGAKEIGGSVMAAEDFTIYTKDGVIDGYPRIVPYYSELFVSTGQPEAQGTFYSKELWWYVYDAEDSVVYSREVLNWSSPQYTASSPITDYSCSVVGEYLDNYGDPGCTVIGDMIPTFGMPFSTANGIASRFGTVANFLRLRNLGQV
jgi:hypothetical protein